MKPSFFRIGAGYVDYWAHEVIACTMQLLGVASIEELGPQHGTQLERLVPRVPRVRG